MAQNNLYLVVEAYKSNKAVKLLDDLIRKHILKKLPGKVAQVIFYQKYAILLYFTVGIFHEVFYMLIIIFNII